MFEKLKEIQDHIRNVGINETPVFASLCLDGTFQFTDVIGGIPQPSEASAVIRATDTEGTLRARMFGLIYDAVEKATHHGIAKPRIGVSMSRRICDCSRQQLMRDGCKCGGI